MYTCYTIYHACTYLKQLYQATKSTKRMFFLIQTINKRIQKKTTLPLGARYLTNSYQKISGITYPKLLNQLYVQRDGVSFKVLHCNILPIIKHIYA